MFDSFRLLGRGLDALAPTPASGAAHAPDAPSRRRLLLAAGACAVSASAAPAAAWASPANRRIDPTRIVPPAYLQVGEEEGVPGALLFAVALQESQMSFGKGATRRMLPWPWTLNVYGKGYRFDTRQACEAQIDRFMAQGISLIDIGAMQVNWHYHKHRLGTPSKGLEPVTNLRVGARILREHFQATGNWYSAAGRYHHPAGGFPNAAPEARKRTLSYADSVRGHIQRMIRV